MATGQLRRSPRRSPTWTACRYTGSTTSGCSCVHQRKSRLLLHPRFGFTETAYSGLETGRRDRVSHVLEQGRIRLVVTGTLAG